MDAAKKATRDDYTIITHAAIKRARATGSQIAGIVQGHQRDAIRARIIRRVAMRAALIPGKAAIGGPGAQIKGGVLHADAIIVRTAVIEAEHLPGSATKAENSGS